MAGLRCGQYEGSHGKEEEAKARLIHLVDIGYDTPDVRNAIREVNERLIPYTGKNGRRKGKIFPCFSSWAGAFCRTKTVGSVWN